MGLNGVMTANTGISVVALIVVNFDFNKMENIVNIPSYLDDIQYVFIKVFILTPVVLLILL